MRGVVVHHEHRIGYIVIRDQFGEFTVAELSGGYEVVKGDIIEGNIHSEGDETLYNLTQAEHQKVYVQGHGMSERASIRMIRSTR